MVFITSKHLFFKLKNVIIFLKISLVFFYVVGFFQFEGDLVCGQNNSREFVVFVSTVVFVSVVEFVSTETVAVFMSYRSSGSLLI